MRGRFLTLEGSEGAGKSTNLQHIAQWLEQQQIPFVQTREPGGTELGEELRSVLLQPRSEPVDQLAELLIMFAARAQHLRQRIEPALAAGQWVLCDRFTDATYAYQGGGRGMSWDIIAQLETLVQQTLRPDAVILLDLPVEVGLQRAGQRGQLDRFEQENLGFFSRVRQAYLTRANASESYHVVDASLTPEQVAQQISGVLAGLLQQWGRPN